MPDFDMPTAGSWEGRGGWVTRRLAADLSFTLDQAAGLVGNLGYESIQFKTLQEIKPLVSGSRGGYGWAQWTGDRRRNFEKWCAEQNLRPASDEANYGFLCYELRGAYKGFAARLRQTLSIEDACHLTHDQFERPADALDGSYRSGPDRLRLARQALAGAQAQPGAAGGAAAPASPASPAATEPPIETLKAIQVTLKEAGHYGGAIDGLFGPRSRGALSDLLAAAGQPRL